MNFDVNKIIGLPHEEADIFCKEQGQN